MDSPGTVRRLSVAELDSSEYRDLVEQLFGAGCWDRHRRYYQWLFFDNPAAEPADTVPIYVCEHQGRFVGQAALWPFDMLLRGHRRHGGWFIDLYILPEFQRKGIGGLFHRAAAGDFDVVGSLGMTQGAYSLFKKGGWHMAGATTVYTHLLRPLRWLRKKAIGAVAENPMAVLHEQSLRGIASGDGIEVSMVASAGELPESFDAGVIGDGVSTRVCRTRPFLRWRYLENPFGRYSVARLRSRHYESFAVWRVVDIAGSRRAVLVDLMHVTTPPAEILRRFANTLLGLMRATRAEVFECRTSDRALLDALPRGLLSRTGQGMQFVYFERGGSTSMVPCEEWRLYPGDCDVDTFMVRLG